MGKLLRARILLKVDEGLSKSEISHALDTTNNTVTNVCRSFQEQRLEAIERKKPDREYEHSLDGEAEAHLVAIACSAPPEGRERWTLRPLQREMVKRKYHRFSRNVSAALTPALAAVPGKKRTQALVEGDVLYSSESGCSIRVSDGRGFGCV